MLWYHFHWRAAVENGGKFVLYVSSILGTCTLIVAVAISVYLIFQSIRSIIIIIILRLHPLDSNLLVHKNTVCHLRIKCTRERGEVRKRWVYTSWYACLHFLHWIFFSKTWWNFKCNPNKFDLVYVRRQIKRINYKSSFHFPFILITPMLVVSSVAVAYHLSVCSLLLNSLFFLSCDYLRWETKTWTKIAVANFS